MRRITLSTINRFRAYCRVRNVAVSNTMEDGRHYVHFTRRDDAHIGKKQLKSIVLACVNAYWSGFKIVSHTSHEVIVWVNPDNVVVITDNPELAFKLGLHHKDVLNEFHGLEIMHNHELGHIILWFDSVEDIVVFNLKYS